jgi:hypothetical protein
VLSITSSNVRLLIFGGGRWRWKTLYKLIKHLYGEEISTSTEKLEAPSGPNVILFFIFVEQYTYTSTSYSDFMYSYIREQREYDVIQVELDGKKFF